MTKQRIKILFPEVSFIGLFLVRKPLSLLTVKWLEMGTDFFFFCSAEIFLGQKFPQCVSQTGQNANPKLFDTEPDILLVFITLHFVYLYLLVVFLSI